MLWKGLPLGTVQNDLYRQKFKHKFKFGSNKVCEVLLVMMLLVEEKLSAETKEAKQGSIVHDGWTKFAVHFLALFATYRAKREQLVGGVLESKVGTVMSLQSVSPLIELEELLEDDPDNGDEFTNFLIYDGTSKLKDKTKSVGEAAEFTAEVHAGHIRDILNTFYGIDVSEWVTNQTADSCSVN